MRHSRQRAGEGVRGGEKLAAWQRRVRLLPHPDYLLTHTAQKPGVEPTTGTSQPPGGWGWEREGREGGRVAARAISGGGAHRSGPKQTTTTRKKPEARRPSDPDLVRVVGDGHRASGFLRVVMVCLGPDRCAPPSLVALAAARPPSRPSLSHPQPPGLNRPGGGFDPGLWCWWVGGGLR